MTGRAPWADLISPAEWALHTAAGYGARPVPGRRPALLVIDMTYEFTGDGPGELDTPAVLERFPNACGRPAQDAVPRIASLIERARATGVPVCYSTMTDDRGTWTGKNRRAAELAAAPRRVHGIHADLAPAADDVVVTKPSASALYATPLLDELRAREVDTVVVTGCTTGGCVRATVLDAFGAGLSVLVPHDAVFDRSPTPHAASLFDLEMRYANVIDTAGAAAYLAACVAGEPYECAPWSPEAGAERVP